MEQVGREREDEFYQRVVEVTPELARTWLERTVSSRVGKKPFEDAAVRQYADDMAAGQWYLTGDTISFNHNGELLNGNSRCWACIFSGVTFKTSVAWNVLDEALVVMDTGKKRTSGQYLGFRHESNASTLGASVRMVVRWQRGWTNPDGSSHTKRPISPIAADGWLHEHPTIRHSVALAKRVHRQVHISAAAIASAHYLNAQYEAELADEFWESVRTGANLSEGDPVLALRSWIANHVAKRENVKPDIMLVVFLKAMRLWRDGERRVVLGVRRGEVVKTWEPDW